MKVHHKDKYSYLIFCDLISNFFFLFMVQVHTQPVVTASSNITNRPTRAPVAGTTTFKGITVAVSKAGGCVDGDE